MTGIACEWGRLPHLLGQPFALEGEGVLRVVSPEAYPFGVRPGQASTFARTLCQGLIVLPYDTAAYLEAARAIWDAVAVESSVVEPAGPEMVYAEMTIPSQPPLKGRSQSSLKREGSYEIVGRVAHLIGRISEAMGVPVCAGLGMSKLVARQAARISEGNPVYVAPGQEPVLLAPVALSELILHPALKCRASSQQKAPPGQIRPDVARRTSSASPQPLPILPFKGGAESARPRGREGWPKAGVGMDKAVLQRAGKLDIRTVGDLVKLPEAEIRRQFGQAAHLLLRLAQGEDGERVRAVWPPRTIEYGIGFDDEVESIDAIHHALGLCAERIAAVLAKENQFCRLLTLSLSPSCPPSRFAGPFLPKGEELIVPTSRHNPSLLREGWPKAGVGMTWALREELSEPMREAGSLHRAAVRLFTRLKIEAPVTGLRLTAGEISSGSGVQLSFLDEAEEEGGLSPDQRRSLDGAVSLLREKFGVGSVLDGALIHRAQRIDLWTYRLGHIADEPVEVATDAAGAPVRVCREAPHSRAARELRVIEIQNRWRETDWSWGRLSEKACFRVVTDPEGLYELQRLGENWRLRAVAD